MSGKERYDVIFRILQAERNRCTLVIEKMTGDRPALFQLAAAQAGMQLHQSLY
jgi:hypothetical protein